ncbi:MAG: 2-oxoglutarate dehydrogenase E1 component [Leptospiraceae bacterium]|nr:MAG: 2-oxoglutarate dehydrogenase E1 component [Leptospiraceae bacterium]
MNPINYISVLQGDQKEYLEQLYEKYLESPESIPEDWKILFDSLEKDNGTRIEKKAITLTSEIQPEDLPSDWITADLNLKVHKLIQDYRRHGHFVANIDPLGMHQKDPKMFFNISKYGITEADLKRKVTVSIANKDYIDTVENIINKMQNIYCSTTGFEFYYIRDDEKRNWIIDRVESEDFYKPLPYEIVRMLYYKLFSAEYFEKFLSIKYPGKKRFSLEGGESLIPAIATLIEEAGKYDVEQIVIGMAHRGRLNVLANIMGKDPAQIFAEFNENVGEDISMGDVKYHLGYSSDYKTLNNKSIHLSLAFNPSHLEVINPVVMGSVRARQTKNKDETRDKHFALLIHGDAAIAGQGINYEMINMAHLKGYTIGGSIHIVVNNQIGFTTEPQDARSTPYATDIGKLLQTPIFHVNGDDPIAVCRAVKLAVEFRQTFNTDVFIDLICFRKWGHNETDEPSFTQPVMYKKIKKHPGTFTLFDKSPTSSVLSNEEKDKIKQEICQFFENAHKRLESEDIKIYIQTLTDQWKGLKRIDFDNEPDTSVNLSTLQKVTEVLTSVPERFHLNPKLKRLFQERYDMIFYPDKKKIDWGMGELLAYGSLLLEGTPVRISGQDCKRGTFSHRHAAVYDTETGEEYIPLQNLAPKQAKFEIINSLLSEEAVLGFEFGYSLADPKTLVIWEAQFGDFANGAQVIIDQFISSSEAKWQRMSGITLFLPHGYEGQGPEHSSARLERYLQLCSQHNIQVVYPTLPSQIFHLLRRQIKRNYRKPLIVMTPKSLLRHVEAVSELKDFTSGNFLEVIDETDKEIKPEKVTKLIFCTGKIYYELREARKNKQKNHIAIVRIEQLYPFPAEKTKDIISKYPNVEEYYWVQEEPRNQGAWIYMENHLGHLCPKKLNYIGRQASPSPATGYFKVHLKEQEAIIKEAIEL